MADVIKEENVDEDSWLYGSGENTEAAKEASEDPQTSQVRLEVSSNSKEVNSRLSVDAPVFEPKSRPESVSSDHAAMETSDPLDESNKTNEVAEEDGEKGDDIEDDDDDDDDDDDSDDDVQVMIGEVTASATYDPAGGKYKPSYQRQGSQATTAAPSATTPAVAKTQQKGVDLDTVGNINGVSVYEFDMDSLKNEDKPWRKPGADVTDYFNYGFNEDTWTKYCERQRRLRLENKSSSNIVFVAGGSNIAHSSNAEQIKTVETINISSNNNSGGYGSRLRLPVSSGPMKIPGSIDVIGSTARDSRRPVTQEFNSVGTSRSEQQEFQPAVSSSVMQMGINIPPHHTVISLPPPDFNLPPPAGLNLPAGLPPTHFGGPPPPGMLQPQMQMSAGPPPGFPVSGPPFDSFFRPGMPMPVERRPPPPHAFPERPPFGFESFGGPPPFHQAPQPMISQMQQIQQQLPPGGQPPPMRPGGDVFDRSRMMPHSAYPPHPNQQPQQRSPARSDSDISSSDDEKDHRPQHPLRLEPIRHDTVSGPFGRVEDHRSEFRRSNSRDRSRLRESERGRDLDRERGGRDYDYDKRARERDYDRGREYDRGRDYARDKDRGRSRGRSYERERERSRERVKNSRDRERGRSRDADRERSREKDRDRKYARDRDDHSRRRDDDDDYRKQKKSTKVKDEPGADDSGRPA